MRSVTSGKGLALRIGCLEPDVDVGTEPRVPRGALGFVKIETKGSLAQVTIDSELKRTRGIRLFNKNIAL